MPPKKKALVIDDDRCIVAGVQMRLKHLGFETEVAYDGVEGLAKVLTELPDIVLLDVQMPRMDGLQMLSELSKVGENTPPVIMLSASLQDQQTALDAGAQYFLTKPYRSSDLLAAIEAAMRQTESKEPQTTETS